MSDDPVFQAMAPLEQLKIHAEEQLAAYEAAVFRARKENGVTLGEEMRTDDDLITANCAVSDAEYAVMAAKPATAAGAVALLRFVAEVVESCGFDEHRRYAAAIRNAAGFFEGRASAWP